MSRKQPHNVVKAWIDAQPKEPTYELYEALGKLVLGTTLTQLVGPMILYPLGKRVHRILELAVSTSRECAREEFTQ